MLAFFKKGVVSDKSASFMRVRNIYIMLLFLDSHLSVTEPR